MKNLIKFSSKKQAAIFKHEILGQLSDGAWENTNHNWAFWTVLTVEVDPADVGVKVTTPWFPYNHRSCGRARVKTGFNLACLISDDCDLSFRMRAYAVMGEITDDEKAIHAAEYLAEAGSLAALAEQCTSRDAGSTRPYWVPNILQPLMALPDGSRDRFFRNFAAYTKNHLRLDLRKIKNTMKAVTFNYAAPLPSAPVVEAATVIEEVVPQLTEVPYVSTTDVNLALFAA